MDSELMWKSALEQAQLVRDGEVTARELVEASLAAIEASNGELNAFLYTLADEALAAADQVQPGDPRPFAGVPIAIKDLTGSVAGHPLRMGSAALGDFTPDADSATIRRLREAGFIFVGKTNTPEFGILPVTEPDAFGPSRNPWDTGRTPGGSSGGSAAAVSSGMTAIGYGGDGGGSIRIPSSCCGLFGIKPSRGRISAAPVAGEWLSGYATEGTVNRTVADAAAALDVMAGYEPGDPYWAPDPKTTFAEAATREPGKLRVAFSTASPNGAPVHDHCVAAVRETAELLESLGHDVTEDTSEWAADGYVENFVKVWVAQCGMQVEALGMLLGHPVDKSKLEPLTQEMVAAAASVSTTDYLLAFNWLQLFSRGLVSRWSDIDVLLTPTLAQPPLPIGALRPAEGEPAIQMLMNAAGFVPFTPAFNVTGQPAASVPLVQSPDGLPIGVQLVGPPAGEELLLSLSAQLEAAKPWSTRRPELARA
jgi:amidase